MTNERQAIAQAMLEHLSDRLIEFWEEVACGSFPKDRNIRIRFGAETIESTNEKLLASAKEHLELISPLLQQSSLDPARLDHFAHRYLAEAKQVVEREYNEVEAAEYGYGDSGEYE